MEDLSEPPGLQRACPACNSRIEPDHTFCEICGTKMPDLPTCRNCGALFIAPVKFCERCGSKVIPVENPAPGAVETPAAAGKPEPPAPVQSMVKTMVTVPAPSGRARSGSIDDAQTLRSEAPEPVKEKAVPPRWIGGIVLLVVLLAATSFIALPVLTGSGALAGLNKPAAAAITPLPATTEVLVTPPALLETPLVPDALAPLPTQLIPTGQKVYFQVQKNPANARISVIFAGSAGINDISSADVRVTHPGGSVATGIILPRKGVNEISLEGSEDADRVEIIARMADGKTYRVYDELVPGKGH